MRKFWSNSGAADLESVDLNVEAHADLVSLDRKPIVAKSQHFGRILQRYGCPEYPGRPNAS